MRRLRDPSARSTLDGIRDSTLMADGKVTLIDLDPIASSLGSRWDGRREAVYDHVEKGLERLLTADAIFLRISQTEYLIAQPSQEEASAQGFCIRFMRETLRHFLGDDRDSEGAVLVVRRMDGESLEAAPINRAMLTRYAETPMRAPEPRTIPTSPTFEEEALGPVVTCDGRNLRIDCRLEKMVNLRTYDSIGVRVARTVWAGETAPLSARQLAGLCRADIEQIDNAVIGQGLDLVRQTGGKPFTLGLPISHTTLSSLRGRSMATARLKAARSLVGGGVVASLYNVEGAPPGPLMNAIAFLRPFTLKVFASLTHADKANIRGLAGVGMDGISMHCPKFEAEAEFTIWTRAMMLEAGKVASVVALYGLESERRAGIAATLGVTHGGVPAAA